MEFRRNIEAEIARMLKAEEKTGMANLIFHRHIKPVVDIYRPVISTLASHMGNSFYTFAEESTPILYASSSMQTSLSEINSEIGDFVNIVHFNYEDIKNHKFWFVGQLGSYYKSNEVSRYLGDNAAANFHAYLTPGVINSLVYKDLLFNEIFSVFSSEVDNYALNRYLIESVRESLDSDECFSGVIFKSVKDYPGTNFAIYGDAIQSLNPTMINLVEVTDIDDYGCIIYRLVKNTSPKREPLVWTEHELVY
jgi:hypothetical protein